MKKLFLSLTILWFLVQMVSAQQAFRYNASGLEVIDSMKMKMLVEKLGQEGQEWKLTQMEIQKKIADKLQSSRISLLPEDDYSLPYRLYTEIQLLDTTFQIDVRFERVISYRVDKKEYHTFATVLQRSSLGINSKKDKAHPLRILDRLLDDFLKEFKKANSP